jgi:hypothetical protein
MAARIKAALFYLYQLGVEWVGGWYGDTDTYDNPTHTVSTTKESDHLLIQYAGEAATGGYCYGDWYTSGVDLTDWNIVAVEIESAEVTTNGAIFWGHRINFWDEDETVIEFWVPEPTSKTIFYLDVSGLTGIWGLLLLTDAGSPTDWSGQIDIKLFNAWLENINWLPYLYNEGKEWPFGWVYEGGGESLNITDSGTKETDHLSVKIIGDEGLGGHGGQWWPDVGDRLDLTEWDSIKIDWQGLLTSVPGGDGASFFCSLYDADWNYVGDAGSGAAFSRTTDAIDVSALSGVHLLIFGCSVSPGMTPWTGEAELKTYKIWLEKSA